MVGTKPQGVYFAIASKPGKKRRAKILRRGLSRPDIPLFFSSAQITSNPIPQAICRPRRIDRQSDAYPFA